MSDLPLNGLKIVDFTTLLPGPLATLILCESGAEVVKIEPLNGEEMRQMGPRWGDQSALFALLNAGKKCIAVDLKDAGQKAALMPILEGADVLVEQFRPGVMGRLGLDYETLAGVNPGLIYCSITGYGQTGPLSGRAGHDLNYISESGLLALNPGTPEMPQTPPLLAADIAGGAYPAVMNILLALTQRYRTGEGAHIDVAMSENMFPFAFWALAEGWLGQAWPGRGSHAFSGGSARYQLYATKEGGFLAVAALEEKFWCAFCAAIDLPQRLRDDRADPQATIEGVRALIAAHPAEHWGVVFAEVDCCCSLVKSLEEAVVHPHFKTRGLFDGSLSGAGGQPDLTALPLPLSPHLRRPAGEARHTAGVGEHNDDLLKSER